MIIAARLVSGPMRNAGLGICLAIIFTAVACVAQTPDSWPPQNFWPGMEGKLKLRMMLEQHDPNRWELVNLRPVGLVAASFRDDCPDLEPRRRPAAESFDMALTGASSVARANAPQPLRNCTLWVDAAIWADGTEIGDQEELAKFHDERKVWAEEIAGALASVYADLKKIPRDRWPEWDPESVIQTLQERVEDLSNGPHEEGRETTERGYRFFAVGAILHELQTYKSRLVEGPSRNRVHVERLVRYLADVETHLQGTAYTPSLYWMQ